MWACWLSVTALSWVKQSKIKQKQINKQAIPIYGWSATKPSSSCSVKVFLLVTILYFIINVSKCNIFSNRKVNLNIKVYPAISDWWMNEWVNCMLFIDRNNSINAQITCKNTGIAWKHYSSCCISSYFASCLEAVEINMSWLKHWQYI